MRFVEWPVVLGADRVRRQAVAPEQALRCDDHPRVAAEVGDRRRRIEAELSAVSKSDARPGRHPWVSLAVDTFTPSRCRSMEPLIGDVAL